MAYRFKRTEDVEAGLKRIANEQVDAALDELADRDLGPHETVHQVRKRCKKLRGLLRLVRISMGERRYQEENAWFRDSARLLSEGRDRAALRETYDLVVGTFDEVIDRSTVAPVARVLTQSRDRWADSGAIEPLLAEFEDRMRSARDRIESWTLQTEGFEAVEGGLIKTYRRGKKRFGKAYADPTPERFHEWRKRVKYGWYHMRLLRDSWPAELRARIDLFDRLSSVLGDHHDVSIMLGWLAREGTSVVDASTIDALLGIAKEHSRSLEIEARKPARLLFAEKPSAFAARFEAYWTAWREEG